MADKQGILGKKSRHFKGVSRIAIDLTIIHLGARPRQSRTPAEAFSEFFIAISF
jgi:hypothetical protein